MCREFEIDPSDYRPRTADGCAGLELGPALAGAPVAVAREPGARLPVARQVSDSPHRDRQHLALERRPCARDADLARDVVGPDRSPAAGGPDQPPERPPQASHHSALPSQGAVAGETDGHTRSLRRAWEVAGDFDFSAR
jgi:hypothetical protein